MTALGLIVLGLFAGSGAAAASGTQSAVLPQIKAVRSVDLGPIASAPPILGRDGGYSALFRDRSIWLFGDTLIRRSGRQPPVLLSDSCSWTKDTDAADGISGFGPCAGSGGTARQFIPFTQTEAAFNRSHCADTRSEQDCTARWALWPGALIPDLHQNRLLLFYKKVLVKPGFLNFKTAGQGIASWSKFDRPPERLQPRRDKDFATLLFGKREPAFGSAAVVVGTTIYVFGCSPDGPSMPCRLGRVAADRIANRDAWQFYSVSRSWQRDIAQSKVVFNGNDMMSVSYNPYSGGYLAVYSRPMSRTVMLRTAAKPEGPWSDPLKVVEARAPQNEVGWIYDAMEHPEYARANGRIIYVTYSRQTGPLTFELRLVAVELLKR